MNLPRKLKDFVVHGDGQSFVGESKSFTRPVLTMEGEDWKGGGMFSPIKIFTGLAQLECEHTYGGDIPALNRTFGDVRVDATQLRFSGAYQDQATAGYAHVEITIQGRTEEIDRGDDEAGGDTEVTYKTTLVYYKEVVDGVVAFEIDLMNKQFTVYGVDRMAEERAILGL
jgi:uncharacterized protein